MCGADLDARIIRGVRRRQPDVDFQTAADGGVLSHPDAEVLRIAADAGRILVSHDQRAMPNHFERFVGRMNSAGLITVPKRLPIGAAIDEVLLIWAATEVDEWRNRLVWIPL